MSAIHNSARRLCGLLNDATPAGVSIFEAEADEEGYTVEDGKLIIRVEQNQKTDKWEVVDR